MSDLVLSNALVLDPVAGRLDPDRHVVVEGGRIADVANARPGPRRAGSSTCGGGW